MSADDPIQSNPIIESAGKNVADGAPAIDRHMDVPARDAATPSSPHSPGPMSARDDAALSTLQRQRESLAHQARAGDRAALRRYLQLRHR